MLLHSSDIHVDDGFTARANEGDGTKPLRDVLRTALEVASKENVLVTIGVRPLEAATGYGYVQ